MKKGTSLIRTIYLYVAALIGLIMIVVSSASFINMALKAWVFTQAEQEDRYRFDEPPKPYMIEERMLDDETTEKIELTDGERDDFKRWQAEYKSWNESQGKVDYITASRHRQAATNLASILVGIPLYLYHWKMAQRDSKRKEEE